jgi:DNA-binding XRE family transcriptional regulator
MEEMENLPTRKKLIGIREMIGLTQVDMAKHLSVSRATYNRKENHPEEFNSNERLKIQNLFDQYIADCPRIFF